MIPDPMYFKARRLIEDDCSAAFKQANPRPKSAGAKKVKWKPWATPQRSLDLIAALNKGDAEQTASIMMYQFYY